MTKSFSIPPLRQSELVLTRRQSPSILQVFLILGFIFLALFSGVSVCYGQGETPTPKHTDKPTHTDKPPKPSDTPIIIPTDPPVVPTNTPLLTPTNTPIIVPTGTPVVRTNTPVPTGTPIVRTNTSIPTNTLRPTNTSIGPTTTLRPTNTSIPSDTPIHSLTPTGTVPCTLGLTPTATGIPLPTCTPTPTSDGTEEPTSTAQPGGPTSTPRPARTRPTTNPAGVTAIQMDSATAAVMGSTSTSLQGVAVASATASLTPGNNGASLPWPGIGTGSNPNVNASGVPFLLLIAALMTGGGVFFAFKLRGRKPAYDPSLAGGGGAAATMPIHPATVGAFGFTAWLAGQAPMLSQGEQVVLSKVRNGIGSAIQLVGGVSDLKKISEMGTQEFLQLTANSTFPLSGIQRTGFAGG